MKIREKMLLTHLSAAFIPVFLSFILLMAITWFRSGKDVQHSLANSVSEIKKRIDDQVDKHLTYSYFLSRNVEFQQKGRTILFRRDWNQISPIFNLKLFEVSYRDKVSMREFISPEYSMYITSSNQISKMWQRLSQPYYHRGYRQAFPEIASNTLVIRNTSLVYDYLANEKTGLVVVSFPVDLNFLDEVRNEEPDTVLFCVTSNDVVFSEQKFNDSPRIKQVIRRMLNQESDRYYSLRLPGSGRYYFYYSPLFRLNNQTLAYVGVLKGFTQVARFYSLFRWVSLIVFLLSAAFGVLIAINRSSSLTRPLEELSRIVQGFQKNYQPIQAPQKIEDEIDTLYFSFSQMSDSILKYKNTIDSYNTLLSHEVEEKTRELLNKIRSLSLINDFSSFVLKMDTLDEQKFLERSVQKIAELLELCHISVYTMQNRNIKQVYHLSRDKKLNKKNKIEKVERVALDFVKHVFMQGGHPRHSAQTITFQASPVYFIDQIEYVLVYMGQYRKKEFIEDSLLTLSNLLSLSVYTLRINSEKIQSEKMASLGQFASTVIHDIKNPLGLIKGAVEILNDDDYTEKEKQEYHTIINRELDMLLSMLNDIMDFARGNMSLTLDSVEIDQLMQDLLKFYKKKIEDHKLKLIVDLKAGLTMQLDRNRIWRVFSNIVSNAIEAMEPGGTLSIKTVKKMQDVMVMITDTGKGIPQPLQQRIFEPFVTFGKEGGTGLGLAIVKRIVDAHGGNVTFSSTPGKGTSFYIFLPF